MTYYQLFWKLLHSIFEFMVCLLISGVFSYFYKDRIWSSKYILNRKMERYRDLRAELDNRRLSREEKARINKELDKKYPDMIRYGQRYFLMKLLHYLAFFLVICMYTQNLFCRGVAIVPLIFSFLHFSFAIILF